MRQVLRLLGVSACVALLAMGMAGCSSTSGATGTPAAAGASTSSTTTTTVVQGLVAVTGTLDHVGRACLILHSDDGVEWAIGQSPAALGLIVPDDPKGGPVIVDTNGTALAHDGDHVTVQGLSYADPRLECQDSTMVLLVSMVAPG